MYAIQILRDSGAWHYVAGEGYRGEWLREAKLVQSSNSIGSLTLSVLPSYPLLSELTCNRRVRAMDEDTGEYVFYGRVIDATPQMDEDGAVFTEVTCEDALGFLQDTAVWIDSRKGYFEGTNANYPVEIDDEDGTRTIASADLLSILLAQHNSTVGDYHGDTWKRVSKGSIDVDADDETTFEAEYQATTYEMLQDLAEDADWEYRSRYDGANVYIDVADQLGGAGGTFKVGGNMKSAALKTTMADVATRVFPYGAEYAKLDKVSRKGTKVTGRVKGEDFESKGTMVRFPCDESIKCVLTVAARKDGYAMAIFTSDLLTSKNVKKVTVKKYVASKDSSEACTKRYPVPDKAKYVYVMGAGSECTTYGYFYNAAGNAISKNYRTDLGFWKKRLTQAKLDKILAKYGVTMGSVVDGSSDRSYFLSKNEDKYGVIEYSPVKTQSLKTDKITNGSKAVYSIDDLKGANKAKATAFIKWACRKLKRKCRESCELTVTGYDLKEAGLAYDALRLYDTWTVVNELAGISASAEVVRVERDLLKPWCVEVEMGSKVTRSSASTRGNGLEGDGTASDAGDDDDSAADEYETLVNQYADAAEAAAAEAVKSADELDSLSRRIQVDSLAAGQMASEAYDTVHPITQAMRDALDQAAQQAHEITAVKEANSQTVEVTNSLARAVASYSYETEKSVVAWRQTYTASMDAWASEDAEVQAKIKAAYAKLYGDGGTADSPTADSAQGKLDSAKAANVEAAAKEAQMRTELASAKAYQASCVQAAASQQEAYEKALVNYKALKKKTNAKKREIDAAWTALQASLARRDESQAAVDAADARVAEAEANYAAAKAALEEAEGKVDDAAAEVETAMNGIHEVYSSCIEQTAQKVSVSVSKTDMDGAISDAAITIKADAVTSAMSKVDAKGYQTYSDVTQTLSGWAWKIGNSDAAAYMSFTNDDGTGVLTLGGKASSVVVGDDDGSSVNITSDGDIIIYNDVDNYAKLSSGGLTCYTKGWAGATNNVETGIGGYIDSIGMHIYSGISFDDILVYGKNSNELYMQYGTTPNYLSGEELAVTVYGSVATSGNMTTGGCTMWPGGRLQCGGSSYGIECANTVKGTKLISTDPGTTSSSANVFMNSSGYLQKVTSSSKRYKHDIADIADDVLDPSRLYDIPVRQYVFDDGYLDDDDALAGCTVVGLIAEEVAERYPVAAYSNDDGQVENWNERYIIPPMLKLIQDQKAQIDALEARVAALEGGHSK